LSTQDPQARGLFAWFASNHVAANLLMMLLLALGGALAINARVAIFPDIDPRLVPVSVVYPGATPQEVEEGISRRVEEALAGIEGIDRVRSVSAEGIGTVTAELTDDADAAAALDDIKSAVDTIQNFPPQDAENSRVSDSRITRPVLTIAISGDADEHTLRELAFRLRDGLTSLDGVSVANVEGIRDYEIGVEVSEHELRALGLSFQEVANAVSGFSVNLPGGSIRSLQGEILLRTDSQAYRRLDFEDLVVRTNPDGSVTRLREVATIVDGFEDVDRHSLLNGAPAAYVTVKSVGDQQVLDVEGKALEFVEAMPLPEGVAATVTKNRANILRSRIDLLVRNGLMGLILVFGVLVLFLDLRLAFWTTMGIPISFLGAFIGITALGGSINMISLFAFILVLGIVVDDAIVVGENIFAKREHGMPGPQAAREGLREVISPVSIGVLTTILAFIPLYFTEGFFGDILWVVPVVVISVLAMSLVESFLILPAHLSGGSLRHRPGLLSVVQDRLRAGLQWLIEKTYVPVLKQALRWRYLTVAISCVVLMLTIGLVAGGYVRSTLFPEIDADDISARVTMVSGTAAAETEATMQRIADAAESVRVEFDAETPPGEPSIFRNVSATLGSQPFGGGGGPGGGPGASGSNAAEIAIALTPGEERSIGAARIVARWKEVLGEIPGATSLEFTSSLLTAGDDISVELAHADFERLLTATERLKLHVAEFGGVSEITDSFDPGKRQLEFSLTPAGIASGLTARELARQVRQAYYGAEAQRVQRGRDDIKVLVRYTEDERHDQGSLERLRIRLPDGVELPLSTVASWTEGRGYATIDRTDRRRIVRVTADVDEKLASANDLNSELRDSYLPALVHDVPGLKYSFEGAEKERIDSLKSLLKALAISVIGIYALIAGLLRSYMQPLIIISVIPFGVVGAVLGHALLGFDLSFFSMFGVVALSGVVINDSLVLMDMVNRLRAEGASPIDAIITGGQRRFRAILFTTLTTCVGLAPMVMEKSMQAQFLIPMAISLMGGVAFATLITLVLVPSICIIVEDLKALGSRLHGHMFESPEGERAVTSP